MTAAKTDCASPIGMQTPTRHTATRALDALGTSLSSGNGLTESLWPAAPQGRGVVGQRHLLTQTVVAAQE